MGVSEEVRLYFDTPIALAINAARLDHLASLGLDLEAKRVLEVGTGVGHLTGFWEERGCEVVSTEGREILVKENLRRHPERRGRVFVADLCQPGSHDRFGRFDIVFCYGTLYHLDRPVIGLQNMAGVCDGLLLLETMVFSRDNRQVNFGQEAQAPHQSLHGKGCRPGRDWVMDQLEDVFEYVYLTRSQPNHSDFPLEWPAEYKPRAVFVASRHKLDLPTLTTELLMRQETT